jgi:hypothetical protein
MLLNGVEFISVVTMENDIYSDRAIWTARCSPHILATVKLTPRQSRSAVS